MDLTKFDPESDLALVRGFRRRDPVSIAELENRLQSVPRILSNLNRRMGTPLDPDELADLAQDIVVIILRKLDEYVGRAPFGAWVYRVCSLELRNGLRRKRRQPRSLVEEGVAQPAGDDPVARLARRELVLDALERIQAVDARVVSLHHLDGLTLPEIAERLEVSLNTVKGRYYRGIQKLQSALRPRLKPENRHDRSA